jgi:hypothetical protein
MSNKPGDEDPTAKPDTFKASIPPEMDVFEWLQTQYSCPLRRLDSVRVGMLKFLIVWIRFGYCVKLIAADATNKWLRVDL